MLLGRLRVRGKLAVLVATPLAMVMILAAFVSVDRFSRAGAAARTVQSVEIATEIGGVVADLQQERLISVGYLLNVAPSSDVSLATATVGDQVADVNDELGDELPSAVAAALTNVDKLDSVRDQVLAHHIQPDQVITEFSDAIAPLLSALRLADGVDASTVAGREVIALDALLRVDELSNRAAAELVVAAGTKSPTSVIAYAGDRAAVNGILSQFTTYATSDQVALYGLVGKAFTDRIGLTFDQSFATAPTETIAQESAPVIYPELTSFVVLGRFVETKIAADVTSAVTSREDTDLVAAYGTAGVALLMVLLIALLSIAVARAVATPLTQLTATANRVARIAQAELERVADDESDAPEPIRLETVSVTALDEVGDLARAFERVQGTAARLVERQVQSRRNVAEMLGHIGRRTQNLVGRQIAVIDGLESDEGDTSRLSELYRLDHIASRLRRNAGSLVVLSGAADAGGHFAPLPLVDVARLALGEIEAYTRVDIAVPDGIFVAPAIINDLVLLFAELMENATAFSPPHTRVTVTASADDRRVAIIDHGIGLSDKRIAEENGRIAQRERLDLAPTEVLGLFVVGRLARRHNLRVMLSHTEGGGLTVRVDLEEHLLAMPTERILTGPETSPSVDVIRGSARVEVASRPYRVEEPSELPTRLSSFEPLPRRTPDPANAAVNGFGEPAGALGNAAPEAAVPAAAAGVQAWDHWAEKAPTAEDPAITAAKEAAAQVAAIQAATQAAEQIARRAGIEDAELVDDEDDDGRAGPAYLGGNGHVDVNGANGNGNSFNGSSLDRAMMMLESVKPWNAFELPQPALPAAPAQPQTWSPTASSPAPDPTPFSFEVPLSINSTPPAPATPHIPPSAPPPPAMAGMPLARRVPGATNRDELTIPVPQQKRPQLDASEARQLIEQFEFGVARALREVEDEPVQAAGPGGTGEA